MTPALAAAELFESTARCIIVRRRAHVIGVVACTVVVSTLLGACGQTVDAGPLADLIRKAEIAQLNVTEPPASYVRTGEAFPVRQAMVDRAEATLARLYADPALSQQVARAKVGITAMLDQKAGGGTGGVSALLLSAVQMTGDQASARARVTVWFKAAQFWWQDSHTRPPATNIIDLELHFIRRGGLWKIDRESWRYAPGGGP